MHEGEWHLPFRGTRQRTWAGTLNRIEEVTEDTCGGNWWLNVKLALPAANEALFLLLSPSPGELLEGYFEPQNKRAGLKGPRRDRDRRRRKPRAGAAGRFARTWAQPDVEVGKRLPAAGFHAGRSLAPGEYAFWTAFNTAERVAWYWLVFDAAKAFTYAWHSGIMESRLMSECYSAAFSVEAPVTLNQGQGLMFQQPQWKWLQDRNFINIDWGQIKSTFSMYHKVWWWARWEGSVDSPFYEPNLSASIHDGATTTAADSKKGLIVGPTSSQRTIEIEGFGGHINFGFGVPGFSTGISAGASLSVLSRSTPW